MKKELIYVELTTEHRHDEEAWIGYGFFNRTRSTVYFNGRILGKGKSSIGNFVDIVTGEYFWVSGPKKNGQDRHWAGHGKIYIDKEVIQDYLNHIGESTLQKSKYLIVEFNNEPQIELSNRIENKRSK